MMMDLLGLCEAFLPVMDRMGESLGMKDKDFSGNLQKMVPDDKRAAFAAMSVEDVLLQEIRAGVHQQEPRVKLKDPSVAAGLTWTLRALTLNQALFEELVKGETSLNKAARAAYERTLIAYHGLVIRNLFRFALRVMPAKLSWFLSHVVVVVGANAETGVGEPVKAAKASGKKDPLRDLDMSAEDVQRLVLADLAALAPALKQVNDRVMKVLVKLNLDDKRKAPW